MLVPVVLFLLSGLGWVLSGGLSELLSGQAQSGPAVLALLAAVASLLLALRAASGPRRSAEQPRPPAAGPEHYILIDGSNVMHWKDGTPNIATVREAVRALAARGFTPGVVFDANVGYKVAGKYLHHNALGDQLGLPEDQVLVVPKGQQADLYLLHAARHFSARILTNDRFRDWKEDFPEVTQAGHLIRGNYRNGKLWIAPAAPPT